ncbi:MAG: thioredoxin [Rhodospirillales bacterium]|nr:thioredoxin [Rhodospirillales bacterium]
MEEIIGQVETPADAIKDSDIENFAEDVLVASQEVPVIVDFWAPWCGPCKTLGPMIEKMVRQAGGLVRLVKINIDDNQDLAAQMRIQSIPAVYAFKKGQPVDGFVGAQPETQIRSFIDRLLAGAKPPLEQALEAAKAALDSGDHAAAQALYLEIMTQEPDHAPAVAGLLRTIMAGGDMAGARELVAGLTEAMTADSAVAAAITALELAEQGGAAPPDTQTLRDRLAADGDDHQARLDLAIALYGADQAEDAVDALLELVRRAADWNDGAGRLQLIKIFDALGPTHELTLSGRRRLSSILFS